MPQPRLPTELLRAIIAELALSRDPGKRADLVACCLASKAMLPLAQEQLYKTVYVITSVGQKDKAPLVRRERLSATIRNNPRIAALVKTLELHWCGGATERPMVQALVSACERLEQLWWHSESFGDSESAGWFEGMLKNRGKTLLALGVQGYYSWSTVSFVDMLHHLPRLQDLTLHDLHDLPDLRDALAHLPRPSFHLQALDLPNPAPPALFDLLLGASQDSLETLRFGGVKSDDVYDFSSFHSLRHVELTPHGPSMDRTELLHLFRSVDTMPSLRTLNVESDGLVPDFDHIFAEDLEAINFLRLLPPSLRHIYQHFGLGLSTPYLLEFLNDRTCLPLSKRLEIRKHSVTDGKWVRRPTEEVDAIESAAKARGVEVLWRERAGAAY